MAASTGGDVAAAATFSHDWRERIVIPTAAAGELSTASPYPPLRFLNPPCRFPDPSIWMLAGVVGTAFGLLSQHRARLGAARAAATYALNLAMATGCYAGEVSRMEVPGLGAAKFAPLVLTECKSLTSWLRCYWKPLLCKWGLAL
jgi:hypothetical protein